MTQGRRRMRLPNLNETNTEIEMRYSLWLCFAPDSSAPIQSTINQLAIQYTSLAFPAHMTICSGLTGNIDQLKSTLIDFAEIHAPISLLGKQFSYRKTRYQSLFIELELNEALRQFQKNTLNTLYEYTPASLSFFPHVSLAYLEPSTFDAPSAITQLNKQLLKNIIADRLLLMETSGNQDSWNKILELKLGGR